MYKESDLTKPFYRTGEAANLLGVTTKTIQNYDARGILKFSRVHGRRIIHREDMAAYLKSQGLMESEPVDTRRDVLYARVSSHEQKAKGDLDRQALYLFEHTSNLNDPLVLKEVGSGLNDKRPQLQRLIRMVMANEVRTIYVTYKDRLARFGFHYLEAMAESMGTEIVVMNDKEQAKAVEDELVEDMMALVASFSGKLYGLRSHKNMKDGGNGNGKD